MSRSSVSQTPCSAGKQTEAIESCGEKCANLCRVYKLIMVSRVPAYGHLEYLVLELLIWSHHSLINWIGFNDDTLIYIWVDWGTWRTQCCPYFWISRSTPVIILWTATQTQRDHEIIHARNFCVQPQATIGSSIVEYVVWPFSVVD